jgi:hypothetical protein
MKNRIKNRIYKNHAAALLAAAFTLGAATAFGAIDISMVPVGYINNAADTTGYGAVAYEYQIGTYEVTNAQYVAFLNAVVGTGADTYSLYNSAMSSDTTNGGITRNVSTSAFEVKSADWANKPVNYVSFYDAARFANWLTNGAAAEADTENGLYVFSSDGTTLVSTPNHATSIGWAIANEDEWYKAAYYNPTLNGNEGGYTNYPFAGGGSPTHGQYDATGANYQTGAVTNVGFYTNATSYFKTYDQAGNLWEWTDITVYPDNNLVWRGGCYLIGYSVTELSTSTSDGRLNAGPANEGPYLGFRVAYLTAVPEPGTVAGVTGLAALVIGMWVRRGRRA